MEHVPTCTDHHGRAPKARDHGGAAPSDRCARNDSTEDDFDTGSERPRAGDQRPRAEGHDGPGSSDDHTSAGAEADGGADHGTGAGREADDGRRGPERRPGRRRGA